VEEAASSVCSSPEQVRAAGREEAGTDSLIRQKRSSSALCPGNCESEK